MKRPAPTCAMGRKPRDGEVEEHGGALHRGAERDAARAVGAQAQAEGGGEREGGQRHGGADEVELPDADLGGDHPDEVVDEADRRHAGHDQAGAARDGMGGQGHGFLRRRRYARSG